MNARMQELIDINEALLTELQARRDTERANGNTKAYNSTCRQISELLETIADLADAGELDNE